MKENQAQIMDQLSDIRAMMESVNLRLATASGGARVAIGVALMVVATIGYAQLGAKLDKRNSNWKVMHK